MESKVSKVVVLAGGLSTERKISFSSGTRVCAALRERGYRAVLADPFMGLESMDEEIQAHPERLFDELPPLLPVVFDGVAPDLAGVRASRCFRSPSLFGVGVLELCRAADVVFIALHGMNGEDGRIQAVFDMLGIRYTGSGYLGAAMAMDKQITRQMVRPLGIPLPDGTYYRGLTEETAREASGELRVPCVVKTPTGGSSVGVFIVRERAQLLPALLECRKYSPDVLVEQYVAGREFTCAVLGDRALPSVEIAPRTGFYDYSNKYQPGASEEICPGRCTAEVERRMGEIALAVHEALGLRTYSRSDFIVTEADEVFFLEVNTLPGMTPTSLVPQAAAAAGISYGELCERILRDA